MNQRKTTIKQKFEQQIEKTRQENEELMRLRLSKKKIDLNGRFDKKDIHNILNSLLQGEVIEEDLFNEFWSYYFNQSATMKDVVKSYNNTLIMLIQKIAKNNNRINELNREKERLKQNHDFKNVNMINLDLDSMEGENRQYRQDLKELSKPFQFNFTSLIENFNMEFIKSSKSILDQSRQGQKTLELPEQVGGNVKNMFDFINTGPVDDQEEEKSEEIQLNNQEKYHRFTVYVCCIALIIDLTMVYNKFNFLDILVGILFAGNSFLEDYLFKNDLTNKVMAKIEINFIDDKLVVKDAFTAEQVKSSALISDDKHSFQNYANSSFVLLMMVVVWDSLWLIVLHSAYYDCERSGFVFQTDSFSFWKYNRYILYASLFTLLSKIVMLIFMFQVAELTPQRIFSRHNFSLIIFRFSDIAEVMNSLIYSK